MEISLDKYLHEASYKIKSFFMTGQFIYFSPNVLE